MAHEAANSLRGNRSRPRSIVPAIPLPYVQKRKLVATASKEDYGVASDVGVENITTSTSDASAAAVEAYRSSTDTNGTTGEKTESSNGIASGIATSLTSEIEEKHALGLPDKSTDPTHLQEQTDRKSTADQYSTHGKQVEPQLSQTVQRDQVLHEVEARQEEIMKAPSDKQSNTSRSSYNMPPEQFIPGQYALPYRPALNNETSHHTKFQPSGGNPPTHHAHPSQGSLVFGGYPDSNNSSPAPPLSASGMPHGPFQPPPHANGHMHHPSNGFQVPPPPGFGFQQQHGNHMVHNPAMDNFGRRHPAPYQTPEGYSPSGTSTPGINEGHRHQIYDPSSHGAHTHSLGRHEQDSRPTQFPNPNATFQATNGGNGHPEDAMLYHQPQMSLRSGSGMRGIVPHPSVDNLDGLLSYIQGQFADPSFADYTLEVRYTDDRAAPMRIPGHNLMFARSPTLKRLMMARAHDGGDGNSSRTILIESADRFLCTDGFWTALQRLYGGSLLDLDTSPNSGRAVESQNMTTSNPALFRRFELALGYAAAGHILQIPPVVSRGIDVACHLVHWSTLEKALDFALEGGLSAQWAMDSNFAGAYPRYGPAVDMLIHSALSFLIANFPLHLDFDVNSPAPAFNRRLPALSGGNVAKHNPRLSSIKFGDHSIDEPYGATANNASPASLISRVLINLPFQLLKYVLEAPALGSVDWATPEMRLNVMREVINERERRRLRARDDKNVSNEVRMSNLKEWQPVGWQEAVDSDATRKLPILTRTWVDFKLPE